MISTDALPTPQGCSAPGGRPEPRKRKPCARGNHFNRSKKETNPMTTLTEVLARHDIEVADELLANIDVPILTRPQRQGDVGIFPRAARLGAAERAQARPVPAEGIAVVQGEATGNTHLLSPDIDSIVLWLPAEQRDDSVLLGTLIVERGAAFLLHTDEHGANGIGEGVYTLRGKREMAKEIRRVAD